LRSCFGSFGLAGVTRPVLATTAAKADADWSLYDGTPKCRVQSPSMLGQRLSPSWLHARAKGCTRRRTRSQRTGAISLSRGNAIFRRGVTPAGAASFIVNYAPVFGKTFAESDCKW